MMSLDGLPAAPGAWPLVGHVPRILRDPLAFMRSLPNSGDLVEVRIATQKIVVVCDPGLTRRLLVNDRVFDKGGAMFDRLREVAGNGIGTCAHHEHRRQRRAVQPAFSPSHIPAYATAMTTQVQRTTDQWRDGQRINVPNEMLNLSARIIAATLFSETVLAERGTETLDDMRAVMAGVYRRILLPTKVAELPTPATRRYHRARSRLRVTVSSVIATHRASAANRSDLLSLIINPQRPDAPELSDAEVADQVVTFLLAGIETSANALAWTLLLLALHPRIQRRLHTELDSVLAGRTATVEDLPSLPMAGRIVTESLRLYPPGWLFTRVTTTDTPLGTSLIPAGTIVAYSPYLIHHRPDVFAEPECFDPDRWDDHTAALAAHSSLIAFSAGPRQCIGASFALTQMCIALATIGTRFHLSPASNRRVRPALDIQLRPRTFHLRIASRDQPDGRR